MKQALFVVIIGVVTAIIFCGCYTNQFGSYSQDSKISYIEGEINRQKRDVIRLKSELIPDYSGEIKAGERLSDSLANAIRRDSLNERENIRYLYEYNQNHLNDLKSAFAGFDNNSAIQKEIDKKEKRIGELEVYYESLINEYIKYDGVPKEITRYEAESRSMANNLRRQEMVLKKVEDNLSGSNSKIESGGQDEAGLKVIIENNYSNDITFKLCSVNGAEVKSVCLAPSQREEINLIPGKYLVSTLCAGRQLGEERILNIDGSLHDYKGKRCYGFVYMSKNF